MSLFDDDDDIQLTINDSFAEQYESKKQKEEFANLRLKYGDIEDSKISTLARKRHAYGQSFGVDDLDSDESSSEEEDENGELVTPDIDAQILRTIATIRAKAPEVYQKDKWFFDNPDDDGDANGAGGDRPKQHKDKAYTLKDLQRDQVLQGILDTEESEQRELQAVQAASDLTHVQEQAQLRDSFKSAAAAADEVEDEFFVKRPKTDKEKAEEEADYRKLLLERLATPALAENEYVSKWRDYETRADVDENEKFLMGYVLNRGWMERPGKQHKHGGEDSGDSGDEEPERPQFGNDDDDDAHRLIRDVVDLDEDERAVDDADRFEAKFNFRFEEEGAENVQTFSRKIANSARRADDRRKTARERKKERKEQEKLQKAEELKRLKNLKRQDIYDRLKQIQEITGNQNVGFDEIDLDGEFDPNQYDEQMTKLFDDKYYAEVDPVDQKPEWGDDIDISDLVGGVDDGPAPAPPPAVETNANHDEDEDVAGGKKKKKKKKSKKSADAPNETPAHSHGRRRGGDDQDDDDLIMDADYLPGGAYYVEEQQDSQPQQQNPAAGETINQDLDEIYRLDYEDIVGGVPVRFGYRQVRPATYGLSVEDILEADEKDLNTFVSIKKMAPYRPPEVEERDLKKYSKKHRVLEWRRKIRERQQVQQAEDTDEHHADDQPTGDDGNGKKKKKTNSKKRKEADNEEAKHEPAKVSQERLSAYAPVTKKSTTAKKQRQ
ncbi:Kinetochore protein Spc24 [Sorochytrium milnesiophthora]